MHALPPPSPALGRSLAFHLRHHDGIVRRLRGDAAGAREQQRAALALLDDGAAVAGLRLRAQLELARLALDAGDVEPALALAARGPAAAAPAGPLEAERLELVGLALREGDRADEARAPLALAGRFWLDAAALEID